VNASPGRIVHYRLSADDVAQITRRRTDGAAIAARIKEDKWPLGAQAHIGNSVTAGDYYPAMVVRTWPGSISHNLQVFLDGCDVYWTTSRTEGDQEGQWCWPPRVES
jgi:hypothetical protein